MAVNVFSVVTGADDDGDGIPNDVEIDVGLNPNDGNDAALDLDGDGRTNIEEYLQGANIAVDDVAPLLSIPADLVVNSTGPTTAIDLGVATATDMKDGAIVPVVDNPGPYVPGRHILTWSATDQAGNTATAQQIVDVIPMVSFSVSQAIDEGTDTSVSVTLNGSAVTYPVTVPYTVAGTAESPTDHNLVNGEVVIESGIAGSIEITSIDDGIWEGDETIVITMGTPTNAVPGSVVTHTVTLKEENIAPLVSITVEQNGLATSTVYADAGPVVMTAIVTDPNPNDVHSYDWSMTSNSLIPAEGFTSATFTFDPIALSAGIYPLALTVIDDGDGLLSGLSKSLIRVENTAPSLSDSTDSDGDGLTNADEGTGDSDGDRIADYLDASNDPGQLPTGDGSAVIQVDPGVGLMLGDAAYASGNVSSLVTMQNLMDHGGDAGGVGVAADDSGYQYPGGIFDFIATGVEVGGTVRIVIPQTSAIPDNAVYRKYVSGSGWFDFVEDANNAESSAQGSLGNCPAPGDVSYTPSLTEGHYCVQLTIQDGGSNDADGQANGVIKYLGGVAVQIIPMPVVEAAKFSVSNVTFNAGDGEKVVLGFMLTSDSTDAEVNQLTIAASGDVNETADIGMVRLYRDDNKNGIPEATERVAEGSFDADDGDITFTLPTAYHLPIGDTHFLVTYQF